MLLAGSILMGFIALAMIPLAEKNIFFLFAIPMAGIFFLFMILQPKQAIVLLLFTRSLLDLILVNTKVTVSGGSDAGIGGILNLLMIGLATIMMLKNKEFISKALFRVRWWILFLIICAVSSTYAPDRATAIKFVMQQASCMLIFLIPFFVVKDGLDKKFWIKILFFSSFIPILLADFGLVTGKRLFYLKTEDAGWRLRGTFTHPNILSVYLVLAMAIIFYIIKSPSFSLSSKKKNMIWFYVLNLAVLLFATKTRSAWIACWLMFVIYGFLKEKRYMIISLLLTALLIFTPQIQERMGNLGTQGASKKELDKNSWHWRTMVWSDSLPLIQASPFFGHGSGSFKILSPTFSKVRLTGVYAHNVYVEMLFETGIIGLVFYIAFFLSLIKANFFKMIQSRGSLSRECAIMIAYLTGYLVVCFSDNMHIYITFNWYFYFFLGITMRSLYFSETSEKPQTV